MLKQSREARYWPAAGEIHFLAPTGSAVDRIADLIRGPGACVI